MKQVPQGGVPQGSVLGPLLFLVMISDINEKIKHSILSSFADNTRLMKAISCVAQSGNGAQYAEYIRREPVTTFGVLS